MKNLCLALTVLLALASAAVAADDDTTTKTQTAPQQQQPSAPAPQTQPSQPAKPAAPSATSPAAPEAPASKETPSEREVKQEAPRETPQTAPAKAEAGAPAQPAKKAAPQTACAQALVPLADVYRDAYVAMRKFIDDVEVQGKAADERVSRLEKQIQDDEAAMTKARLDGDNAKEEDLSRQDKQLWKDLKEAKKERASLCSGFARDTKQKVRAFAADAEAKLADCQQRMEQ